MLSQDHEYAIAEYNAYNSQYDVHLASYNKAVNNWNTQLTVYNDYMEKVNAMSYATRTSSATQNELSLKASEVRSAGRNVQVESAIFEAHIDDMITFMETNKDTLIKQGPPTRYMQKKSSLVEIKARCEATEEAVNNILNKLD
jgi:hypothetical protein